ncbi:MAG TPA: ABC transporter ATP-binding protein [Azospirillaceae bacterium]|nr:ABC transporter ATP-binding protein [Azospirillaceae bacterium]
MSDTISETPRTQSAVALYKRAFREARSFRWHLLLVLVTGLVGLPLALLAPLPMKIVVDSVLGGQPLPAWLADLLPAAAMEPGSLLPLVIGAAAVLALFTAGYHFAEWMLRDWVAERMVLVFRAKLLRHALTLSPGEHDRGSQDPMHRINHDAPALQWTALYGVIPMVSCIATLLGVLWVTSSLSPELAMVALATSAPVILLIHLSQARMRGRWAEAKEDESRALHVVQETLGASRIVTTFGQEDREARRFHGLADRAFTTRRAVIAREGVLGQLMGLSSALGGAAILYIGASHVQSGQLTLGELLLALGYIGQLYAPLQQIGSHITGQQRALVSAERAFALLDMAPAVEDRPDARPMERASGHVRLEGVGYAYKGRDPVLDGVDLDIPAGTCVGVVGRTGAGKSTLVNMITRQFDPTAGRLLLDGEDLRELRLADLRRQFAVVPQEPALFSTTIAQNIAYGDPDAPIGRIIAAARQAAAHDFIMALPDGYDTVIGERGGRLSGGERQRIAIARAFLTDAPILILDEPTSAIDQATETAIIESLERLMAGRTTFMIAHRLSTLRRADMVIRVQDGRVAIERGGAELRLAS